MITYVNGSFGTTILLRVHGSALYKSALPALISTAIFLIMAYTLPSSKVFLSAAKNIPPDEEPVKLFLHPYPMQALVTAFTFLLVFRANYRYVCSFFLLIHHSYIRLLTRCFVKNLDLALKLHLPFSLYPSALLNLIRSKL